METPATSSGKRCFILALSSASCSRGSNLRTGSAFFSDEGGENSFASLAMDGVGAVPPPRACRTMLTSIAISLSLSFRVAFSCSSVEPPSPPEPPDAIACKTMFLSNAKQSLIRVNVKGATRNVSSGSLLFTYTSHAECNSFRSASVSSSPSPASPLR